MKNAAANDKLKKMVKDQQEAEKKKVPVCFRNRGRRGPGVLSLVRGFGLRWLGAQVRGGRVGIQGVLFQGSRNTLISTDPRAKPASSPGHEPGNPGAAAQAAGSHRRQTDERQGGPGQGGAGCHRGPEWCVHAVGGLAPGRGDGTAFPGPSCVCFQKHGGYVSRGFSRYPRLPSSLKARLHSATRVLRKGLNKLVIHTF